MKRSRYQHYLDLKRQKSKRPVRNLRNLKYQQLMDRYQEQALIDTVFEPQPLDQLDQLDLALDKLWVVLLGFGILMWGVYLFAPMYQIRYVLN